jgi:4-hydroxybenzoate polyprenyltransferase
LSQPIALAPTNPALLVSRFVKLEHTLFSLPVIFGGTLLADASGLTLSRVAWIVAAGLGARTAAMALNRIIDRRIDAANPRTAGRELPARAMPLGAAWGVTLAGVALYVVAAAALSPLCLALSPVPLAVFVLYPYLKRVTPLCHLGVGAALALAPLGGWLAAGPDSISEIGANAVAPLLLAAFTFFWVAGFDIIYATLDEEFDRAHGIRSLPEALGRDRALRVSALLHACGVAALAALALHAGFGAASLPFLLAILVLFALEHWHARNVDLAFFKLNIFVGFAALAFVAAGVLAG